MVKKTIGWCLLCVSIFWFHSNIVQAEIKILILGDSLTEGFRVAPEEAYPYLVEQELRKRGHIVSVINGGFSGSTSASAVSRLRWYLRLKPQIVILALGANDGLRGLDVDNMKKNLFAAVELAQQKGIRILLAGIQMPLNYGLTYTTAFKNAFGEVAAQYNLPLIPFLLQDVAGIRKLNLPDGIHPNPQGYQIITQTVVKYLEPMLTP